jgi:hypothetical protein
MGTIYLNGIYFRYIVEREGGWDAENEWKVNK